MGVFQFTSESYSETGRHAAWQEILSGFGVRSTLSLANGLHATAFGRDSSDGIIVARLAAGAQTVSPIPQKAGLPLVLLSLEEGAALKTGTIRQPLSAGDLVVLPRHGRWVAIHPSAADPREPRASPNDAEVWFAEAVCAAGARDALLYRGGGIVCFACHLDHRGVKFVWVCLTWAMVKRKHAERAVVSIEAFIERVPHPCF